MKGFKQFFKISFYFSFIFFSSLSFAASSEKILRGGWYTWDPYQYMTEEKGISKLTGFDIELAKLFSEKAKITPIYESISWTQHLAELKEGQRDFAMGATYTPERAEYVYYSEPYRSESNSLFVPNSNYKKYSFRSVSAMLDFIRKNNFRLGLVSGFIYADSRINAFAEDPKNADIIVFSENDYESLRKLLKHKIDGFLSDRIAGSTVIWRTKTANNIAEINLGISDPIHMIFSKKTVPYETVEHFNKIIEQTKKTAEYSKMVSWYLYPVLLLQTLHAQWFKIIDIVGTIAFAISGLIIAYRDKSTLWGAFIFAILPSIGGGLLRDIIIGRNPATALQSPIYLSVVIATVLIGFLLLRIYRFMSENLNEFQTPFFNKMRKPKFALTLLTITDALGLAAFTVSGVIICLVGKVEPLWLWGPFFAFVTGAGGGIFRDLLSKNSDILVLKGDFYGEIAVIWGFFLSITLMFYSTRALSPEFIEAALLTTVIGVFVTRMLVSIYKIPNVYFGGPSLTTASAFPKK